MKRYTTSGVFLNTQDDLMPSTFWIIGLKHVIPNKSSLWRLASQVKWSGFIMVVEFKWTMISITHIRDVYCSLLQQFWQKNRPSFSPMLNGKIPQALYFSFMGRVGPFMILIEVSIFKLNQELRQLHQLNGFHNLIAGGSYMKFL